MGWRRISEPAYRCALKEPSWIRVGIARVLQLRLAITAILKPLWIAGITLLVRGISAAEFRLDCQRLLVQILAVEAAAPPGHEGSALPSLRTFDLASLVRQLPLGAASSEMPMSSPRNRGPIRTRPCQLCNLPLLRTQRTRTAWIMLPTYALAKAEVIRRSSVRSFSRRVWPEVIQLR